MSDDLAPAATLDGAGSVRYLIGIALPLLRNTVIVTTAIVLAAQGQLRRGLTLGAVK